MSIALFCYGASEITLSTTNIALFPFTMTGIGLLFPATYASLLVILTILPKFAKLHVKQCFKRFISVNHDQYKDVLLEVGEESDDPSLLNRN